MVAQEFAIRWPHRVRTLILVSTTAGGLSVVPPTGLGFASTAWHAARTFPATWRVNVRGTVHQAWAALTHDTSTRLRNITAPTLVLHGARDALVPKANAVTLADGIPHARLRLIRGAGHFVSFQSPTASDVASRWLHEHRSARPSNRRRVHSAALGDYGLAPYRFVAGQTLPVRRIVSSLA
jgi:poly(3-hydroxyoctanoate) depolymerase